MDNIKQVVKDIRFLITTNCCDETIQARIENFINEREQALRIHDVSGQLPNNLILYRQAKKLDYAKFCKWLNAKLGNFR